VGSMEYQLDTPVSQSNGKKKKVFLVIMVNSANSYLTRRKAIRNSWIKFLTNTTESNLTTEQRESVEVKFVLGKKDGVNVSQELSEFNDIVFVDVEDSYDNLAKKTLEFMKHCINNYDFDYFLHADDDSFIRLDLLLEVLKEKPRKKFYYGYIWNNGLRLTKPIRDPSAKSYMPLSQYPSDEPYPPFACGCGFALSRDLIQYIVEQTPQFKDYRLIDVAFGIYLQPLADQGLIIENDDRIRPYPPLPLFRKDTIIQHYMKPEQFRGFYQKAIGLEPHEDQVVAQSFYDTMANLKLMKK